LETNTSISHCPDVPDELSSAKRPPTFPSLQSAAERTDVRGHLTPYGATRSTGPYQDLHALFATAALAKKTLVPSFVPQAISLTGLVCFQAPQR